MLSPNSVLQNRYLIVRELGHGGMGTVYEAIDQRVNSIVAVKETFAARDGEAHKAFQREAKLLANLRHPALPKVMDFFSENDGDFLVMEFIPGYDLAELLDLRGNPFPQSQVLRWANDLLRALEYLHGQEPPILHRDIKPSNLKLTKQGEIFLLDFGLAKGAAGQMSTLKGARSTRGYTPIYSSLEQIHDVSDPRSDIYSLGATLYHLLSGHPPVASTQRFQAIEDDQDDPLPAITTLNQNASRNVSEVIHRAMTVARKQRLSSASEMRKALRDASEEDERENAEEEYRRAEVRRREREAERKRIEAEQAKLVEEQRQLEEEENKKKAEAARQAEDQRKQSEARRRANEEAQRRAEETEARRVAEENAKLAEQERQLKIERLKQQEDAARRKTEDALRRTNEDLESSRLETEPVEARLSEEDAEKRIPIENEEQRPGVQIVNAVPAATVFADLDKSGSASGIKTVEAQGRIVLKGLPDENSQTEQFVSSNSSLRVLLISVALILVLIVLGIPVWWIMTKAGSAGEAKQPTGTQTPNSTASKDSNSNSTNTNAPQPPPGMVYVPGGEFMMGRDDGEEIERPAHKVTVKPFFIDQYEVTNEEYAKFVAATRNPAPATWINGTYLSYVGHAPVTGVTWDDAEAYAKWAGKRLPTEEEWEFAARGTDGRQYPWGNEWRRELANADNISSALADVGTYKGASPFNVYDLSGNAWEWTATDLEAYPGSSPLPLGTTGLKVIRGNSFQADRDKVTTTFRRGWPPRGAKEYKFTGFRCAKDIAKLNVAPK